jgi:hypothetical protein
MTCGIPWWLCFPVAILACGARSGLDAGGFHTGGIDSTGGAPNTGGHLTGGNSSMGGAAGGTFSAIGGTNAASYSTSASGGQPASGGATIASGGTLAIATGGSSSTGSTSNSFVTVTSTGGSYSGCPTSTPTDIETCECDELPCECSYLGYWWQDSVSCPQGTKCIMQDGYSFACIGGVWRAIGGGSGHGCWCADPRVLYGTGGASGTATGGPPSTGGTSGSGGTRSTGGGSNNTRPTIEGSGGSYSCPTSEPYKPQTLCDCPAPPCECGYRYDWIGDFSCNDSSVCDMYAKSHYTCQDGVWNLDDLIYGAVP